MYEGVSDPVRQLLAAVQPVLAQLPAELPGLMALADLRALLAAQDALRAGVLGRISDVELRQLYALEDASSTGSWIETQPSAAGRDEVALARRLHRMPHLHERVLAGDLSVKTAALLGVALDKAARQVDRLDGRIGGQPGEAALANVIVEGVLQLVAGGRGGFDADDGAFDALLAELVDIVQLPLTQQARVERAFAVLAQQLPASMLSSALDRLVEALTPQRLDDADARAHDHRAFKMVLKSDGSGYTVTRGDLTLELGEYLAVVLAACRATDPDNTTDTAGWRARHHDADADEATDGRSTAGHEPAPGAELPAESGPEPRSRVQQDHDALLLALRHVLDSGALGSRHKVAPHLAVSVQLDTLQEVPGALPAISRTTGALLPRGLVRRLLCDSRLTRVVLDLRGRVLEVSHSERTAKAHERLATTTRWGDRCAEAGCPSPPGTPLIPHHGTPWHRSGSTSVNDTYPLCDRSHDRLHVHGRTLTLRDGTRLGPDGALDASDNGQWAA